MNKSEQLIACLEGEIAKRDARIVELERYDEAVERAAFEAWHKDRYPAVKIRAQNLLGTYTNMQVECNFETWLACAESHSKRFGGALLDANARLNGPPVSEAKARGVVMPTVYQAMLVVLREMGSSKHIRGTSNWCADVGRAVLDEVARLNAAPVQQVSVPDGWNDGYRAAMNSAASGARQLYVQHCHHHGANGLLDRCKELEQSFIRDADAMLAAAPAAPAADDGLVEALDYQVLFDAIAAATSVYANGAINISVQAFRESLAAALSAGKEVE